MMWEWEMDKLPPKSWKDQFNHFYSPWSLFPVSVDDWPLSVLWLLSGLWAAQSLAESLGTAQLGTACHSWPAAQADGQQPNSPISIWSGLNQMPGGELSLHWPERSCGRGVIRAGVVVCRVVAAGFWLRDGEVGDSYTDTVCSFFFKLQASADANIPSNLNEREKSMIQPLV